MNSLVKIYSSGQNYYNTWQIWKYWPFLPPKHDFISQCSWNMQMVALSTTNIRWSESYCFYPLLTLIFGMSTFSAITAAHLSGIVSIYFLRTSTLMLKQLKPKAFLWMYYRSVQFIFQLTPNLLDGVEVRTLRGSVHHFYFCITFVFCLQMFAKCINMLLEMICKKCLWGDKQYFFQHFKVKL